MGVFSKLFGSGSSKNSKGFTPTDNPALSYVQENHGLDAGRFIKSANMVHAHSVSAAREFAELLKRDPTEDSIHFFFDYFVSFYLIIAKPNILPNNKDVSSAIIDGMHMEFYGNVSPQIIESSLALCASDDPCFLQSFLAILPRKDRHMLTIPMAAYSIDKGIQLGATQILEFIPVFQQIQNSKLSSIDAMASVILR